LLPLKQTVASLYLRLGTRLRTFDTAREHGCHSGHPCSRPCW